MADIILPGSAYTEKEGTYVNTEGRAQKCVPAVSSPGMSRTDWKIIRALSEIAGRSLTYETLAELRGRMQELAPHLTRFGQVEEANYVKQAVDVGKVSCVLTSVETIVPRE